MDRKAKTLLVAGPVLMRGLGIAMVAISLAGCAADKVEGPVAVIAKESLPVASVVATTLPPPEYRVGQHWVYSDGYDLRVASVVDGTAKIMRADVADAYYVRRAFFMEESKLADGLRKTVFWSDDPMKLFAAQPGQAVVATQEYMQDGKFVRHLVSWVLEGTQKLRVPAGEFDTWVIVMRTRNPKSGWTAYEKHWYAPSVNNFIRTEYRYGNEDDGARVLMSFTQEEDKK